jgi:diadenosine tetraphosphate (Ap4A) HIT family hydrolase
MHRYYKDDDAREFVRPAPNLGTPVSSLDCSCGCSTQVARARLKRYERTSIDETQGPCPFCIELDSGRPVVAEYGTVMAIEDLAPVVEGHLLIVTRRHTKDLFTMTAEEHADAMTLAGILRERALAAEPNITGFNVGANCGASAGQKVMHAHIHFIPRRRETPIKGAIRNKMAY